MTKRTRRILFYSFVAVFILFSVVVVLIAFGYGYDFVHNRIVKTGALGMASNVSADVYVNNRLEGQTSFFGNSYAQNRLIPGEYEIRLEKKDYKTWQKKVNINEGLYLDFPSIFMVPNNPKTETVTEALPTLNSPTLYGDWLFYINPKGLVSYLNIRNNQKTEFNRIQLPKLSSKFRVLDFDENNKTMLIVSGAISYLIDLNNESLKTLNKLPFGTATNLHLINRVIYGQVKNQLVAYDIAANTSTILAPGVRMFASHGNITAYINSADQNLHIYSLADRQELSTRSLPPGIIRITQFETVNNLEYAVLQSVNGSALYRIDVDQLTKLSDYVEKFQVSPDQSKLLYYNGHEVSVLYTEATNKQPYFNDGDTELITRTVSTIDNPTWYDEDHILVDIGGKLTFIELDGRGERNLVSLADHLGNFAYDIRSNTIYITSDSMLEKLTLQ